MNDIAWDVETYPNCFTLCAEHCHLPITWSFEISSYRDQSQELKDWLIMLKTTGCRMVGFNNVGFDYPILHDFIRMGFKASPQLLYEKAMQIIHTEDRFAHLVYPSDRFIEQIDLYKIHHFDNKARMTSLKALEFNMRMDNISDLPFPVGTVLNPEQITVLLKYNAHDVAATKQFYHKTAEQIAFRESLTKKHGKDFMNASDVSIGKQIFQMELEKVGIPLYEYGPSGRTPRQSKRSSISLRQCIPPYVAFSNPEFQRIYNWFADSTIEGTKAVFDDLTAKVGGLEFVFGTGGLHASITNRYFVSDEEWMILDIDVTSLYPSIAIENDYYPEHLGPKFVEVYRTLREQRVSYKKGSAENAMLKLALNGVYGASNDKFSVFYDPLFTMKITIGGQLMIAMLAEHLLNIEGLRLIQVNTDGITMHVRRDSKWIVDMTCTLWSDKTKLQLESVEYSKMFIRDVNNYIAVRRDGKAKAKGAYEWHRVDVWHKDESFLVIPKVAEKVLAEGLPIRRTVETWPDKMDFMGRAKVPRTSKLVMAKDGVDLPLENTQRYYVSKGGGQMVKIMPPLPKNPGKWRRIGINTGWTVCPCNDVRDAVLPIDYEYYIQEVEKLCLNVM